MEPTAALYYPHTMVQSTTLLKNALLLWDYVECITPTDDHYLYAPPNRQFAEAAELVVRRRVPSAEEKDVVHAQLQELLRDGGPSWLRQDVHQARIRTPYLMYPDKLASETWHLLELSHLASFDEQSGDFALLPALGLFAMSLLATECAGETRTKVTDRERAYAWLMGLMTERLGGEYIAGLDASQLATTYDRLITASVKIVNTDDIPLKRLIDLRKREAAGKAPELQPLRAKYLKALNEHIKRVAVPGIKKTDAIEFERQFVRQIESDFRELKQELRFTAKEALLSKEIGVTVLAVAGAIATPLIAPLLGPAAPAAASITTVLKNVGVGALYLTKAKYRRARQKALAEKTMSWLYLASKRRLL